MAGNGGPSRASGLRLACVWVIGGMCAEAVTLRQLAERHRVGDLAHKIGGRTLQDFATCTILFFWLWVQTPKHREKCTKVCFLIKFSYGPLVQGLTILLTNRRLR